MFCSKVTVIEAWSNLRDYKKFNCQTFSWQSFSVIQMIKDVFLIIAHVCFPDLVLPSCVTPCFFGSQKFGKVFRFFKA